MSSQHTPGPTLKRGFSLTRETIRAGQHVIDLRLRGACVLCLAAGEPASGGPSHAGHIWIDIAAAETMKARERARAGRREEVERG